MFNERISQLEREIQALKTVRRRTSTTMMVETKQVSANVRLKARMTPTGSPIVRLNYYGYVEITPSDNSLPFFYGMSERGYATEGRTVELIPYGANNKFGVLVGASANSSDMNLQDGQTKDVQIVFNLSCTQNFTWTASQIYAGEP